MKSKKRAKIKAFTIMELLVVMGVGALLITAAFFILTRFTSFFDQTNKEQGKVIDIKSFYNNLSTDFLQSRYIKQDGLSIVAVYKEFEVRYDFSSGYLTRDFEGLKDTLFFEGLQKETVPLIEENNNGIIRNLQLNFNQGDEQFSWHFSKHYGAAYYLNNGN